MDGESNDLGLYKYLRGLQKIGRACYPNSNIFIEGSVPSIFRGVYVCYDMLCMLVSGRVNALTWFFGVLRCTKLC